MSRSSNILVCPLDWGLGHATRCVPIINSLLELKSKVLIAGSGKSLEFLKSEFPQCEFINLPSYRFTYSKKGRMVSAMLFSIPYILSDIFKEHKQLKKIISKYNIDGIISDNRFGLWNRQVPCVYMTHQIHIKTPVKLKFLEPVVYLLHKFFIKKYDLLWIPDNETKPWLSGNLSHPAIKGIKHKYIGSLSRFSKHYSAESGSVLDHTSNILIMISGPEPQRTIFENIVRKQAAEIQNKVIILRGLPDQEQKPEVIDNVTIYPHISTLDLKKLIKNAGIIVCRSGYSSIMDLARFGKKVFFVPTPGQTEQEYLASYLKQDGIADFANQKEFWLTDVFKTYEDFRGFKNFPINGTVHEAVKDFLGLICNKL